MPSLRSAADHVRIRTDYLADHAHVNELAAGLNSAAEAGVRSTAEHNAVLACKLYKLSRLIKLRCERLLRVDILSCKDRSL